MSGSPLTPDERGEYGTPQAAGELDEPEARDTAGQLGGAPGWIRAALVVLAIFVALLVAWLLFLPR